MNRLILISKCRSPILTPFARKLHLSVPNSATHREKSFSSSAASASTFERIKAGSTFAISTVFVFGAIGITGLALYAIGSELFSSSGDTKLFNRSINLIEHNLYCQKMLQCSHGDEKLTAHGEDYLLGNRNGWGNRNRPISSAKRVEKGTNNEHYYMRYYVESGKKNGIVQLEAIKDAKTKKTGIRSLSLVVDGERYFVVAPAAKPVRSTGFLGVNWGK